MLVAGVLAAAIFAGCSEGPNQDRLGDGETRAAGGIQEAMLNGGSLDSLLSGWSQLLPLTALDWLQAGRWDGTSRQEVVSPDGCAIDTVAPLNRWGIRFESELDGCAVETQDGEVRTSGTIDVGWNPGPSAFRIRLVVPGTTVAFPDETTTHQEAAASWSSEFVRDGTAVERVQARYRFTTTNATPDLGRTHYQGDLRARGHGPDRFLLTGSWSYRRGDGETEVDLRQVVLDLDRCPALSVGSDGSEVRELTTLPPAMPVSGIAEIRGPEGRFELRFDEDCVANLSSGGEPVDRYDGTDPQDQTAYRSAFSGLIPGSYLLRLGYASELNLALVQRAWCDDGGRCRTFEYTTRLDPGVTSLLLTGATEVTDTAGETVTSGTYLAAAGTLELTAPTALYATEVTGDRLELVPLDDSSAPVTWTAAPLGDVQTSPGWHPSPPADHPRPSGPLARLAESWRRILWSGSADRER